MELQTKYSIGDTVYRASTTTVTKTHDCPDCNNERKWKAVSPAGGEYTFPCPRCSANYHSQHKLSLKYAAYVPCTEKLTIGSIRVDTSDNERPVSYMCRETGIGSGTIHYEGDLHPTEEEAFQFAQARAVEINEKADFWVKTQYDESLELSDYQLTDCKNKIKEREDYAYQIKVENFVNDLTDAETVEEVKGLIETFTA